MKKIIAAGVVMAALAASATYFLTRPTPGEMAVLANLNDPESAKFGKSFLAYRGGGDVWCGEVNAKNRMGGYVGNTRYIANVRVIGGQDYSMIHFEGNLSGEDAAAFKNKWDLFCTKT